VVDAASRTARPVTPGLSRRSSSRANQIPHRRRIVRPTGTMKQNLCVEVFRTPSHRYAAAPVTDQEELVDHG
jgi:hypothetical protein